MNFDEKENIVKFEGIHDFTMFPRAPIILGTEDNERGITSWRVMRIIEGEMEQSEWGKVTVKGSFPFPIEPNKKYTIVAQEIVDERYGLQYDLIYITEILDLDNVENQKHFLQTFLTSGQIIEMYKVLENPLKTIDKGDIKELTKVHGVGEYIAKTIIRRYKENKDYAKVYIELHDLGLTPNFIQKLIKFYKSPQKIIDTVKNNVYQLSFDIKGIGFRTADSIALKNGLDPKSPLRIAGFINYYFQEIAENGNSYVYATNLTASIFNEFGGKDEILRVVKDEDGNIVSNNIVEAIDSLVKKEILVVEDNEDKRKRKVYLKEYYDLELEIARHLKRIAEAPNNFEFDDWTNAVKQQEKEQGWKFTDEQIAGIELALKSQITFITGLAGCVDNKTEFFNGEEWKFISDYKEGDKVLQWNHKRNCAELCTPEGYIKKPKTKFYHFTGVNIDEVLTEEHNVAIFDQDKKEWYKMPVGIFKDIATNGYYHLGGFSLNYTDCHSDNCLTKPATAFIKNDIPSEPFFEVKEYESEDDYKYCFTVPSSMLVLRRNDRMFITSNSGKTSVLTGMLHALGAMNGKYNFAQTALAGKASARMQEVTGKEGYTIHRLLGFNPKTYGFMHNQEEPLLYDIIVLDEISLVGGRIFLDLIKAVKTGSKLIILGDMGQLESIGCLNLAKDLYSAGYIATVELTKVHRQAMKSGILTSSYEIRKGNHIFDKSTTGELIEGELKDMIFNITEDKEDNKTIAFEYFKKYWDSGEVDDIMELQVLCPVKERGGSSVYEMNNIIQAHVNPSSGFKSELEIILSSTKTNTKKFVIREGDKVLNQKNYYDLTNTKNKPTTVYNGWTGIVKSIDKSMGFVQIYFPIIEDTVLFPIKKVFKSVILGYASTIHKYQGSSAEIVIGVVDNYTPPQMQTRELLYTLLTRAKRLCVLVTQPLVLYKAPQNSGILEKNTFLQDMLEDETIEPIELIYNTQGDYKDHINSGKRGSLGNNEKHGNDDEDNFLLVNDDEMW